MTTLDVTTRSRALGACGVLTRQELGAAGWSRGQIDSRIRRGEWRPLLRGVLLIDADTHPPAWADLPFEVRLAAARAFHGVKATFVHETAAQLLGLQGLPPDDGTIRIRLPPGSERHQQPGVDVHPLTLRSSEESQWGGWPITSAGRTVTDLMLRLPRLSAVSVLDSALNLGLIRPDELDDLRLRTFRRRRALISSGWWALADGRADSPLETRVRLLATDIGYPPDHLQYPVCGDGGELFGFGDLGWELGGGRLLIAEADGHAPHELPSALFRDRHRANDFASLGTIEMVRFTWADTTRPEYLRSVLRQHLGAPRISPTR